MPEKTSYESGTWCWADLATPDPAAAKAFYGGLFGWQTREPAGPEFGGYTMFTLGDREVAGVMPRMNDQQPIVWTAYVSVADADSAAKAIADEGGTVMMEPDDVADQGRLAIFADPAGAVAGLWQPYAFAGARVLGEPNTMCWTELATRDVDAAKAFYTAVFGWGSQTNVFGQTTYTEWSIGGRSIAGMLQMNEQWPADIPPHWMVYFEVEDCDAAASRAAELGGTVTVAPSDIEPGRFAVLSDPHGAHFSIIRLTQER